VLRDDSAPKIIVDGGMRGRVSDNSRRGAGLVACWIQVEILQWVQALGAASGAETPIHRPQAQE